MSDTSTGDGGKPMEKPGDDLPEAIGNLSVTADDSEKISSSPKNLSDMPFDVVGLIIERSKYKEQLILRKVSKSLRSLVDQQKPPCDFLVFYVSADLITLTFDKQTVIYTSPAMAEFYDYVRKENDIVVVRDDHEKIALDDLASTLKNPKLQLDKFEFGYDRLHEKLSFVEKAHKKINKQLKSMNRLFTVNKLKVLNVSDLPTILSYLKPELLKTITMFFDRETSNWNYGAALKAMEQVEDLDQWKNAEELILGTPFEDFPMRYARHFKRFKVREYAISNESLLRIRDYFSKCSNFENCLVESYAWLDARDIRELQTIAGQPAPPNDRTEYVSHYSIPDSDDYLEFLFFEVSIEIRKMKRSSS